MDKQYEKLVAEQKMAKAAAKLDTTLKTVNQAEIVDPEVFDKIAKLEAKDEQAIATERLSALEKFKKRRLNAHEAKNLAEQSLVQLNRLYKTIKDQALEGYSRIDWCVDYVSESCIERLLKELELDGYQVDYQKRKNLITIKW